MPKDVHAVVSEEEFEDLKAGKGDRTWKEAMLIEIAGYDPEEV